MSVNNGIFKCVISSFICPILVSYANSCLSGELGIPIGVYSTPIGVECTRTGTKIPNSPWD